VNSGAPSSSVSTIENVRVTMPVTGARLVRRMWPAPSNAMFAVGRGQAPGRVGQLGAPRDVRAQDHDAAGADGAPEARSINLGLR
jgi:hypothetical protein